VTGSLDKKPASTELTGGTGFTYEDTVVAYYLAHLLRREGAAGQPGVVTSVAVQQQGHGNPMDDPVVEFDDAGMRRALGLQIKRNVTISGNNEEFRGIIRAAAKTQALTTFTKDADNCGFVVEHVTADTLRTLKRLIDWAGASDFSADFEARFAPTGAAAQAERELRESLKAVIGAANADEEVSFYRNFTAFRFDGLDEGGVLRQDIINRLQELVAVNEDGQGVLLFDRLCRIAREGAGKATNWTRASLLSQLRGAVRLKISPHLGDDINRLTAYSLQVLNVVSGWAQFATSLSLSVTDPVPLLVEIGSAGTPILFIDGVDRIRPDQQGVVVDLVNAIHNNPDLSHWKVLVSSRDQGLEAFRSWFPTSLYAESGIGDVIVKAFSDEEAEQLAKAKPQLHKLLFGSTVVRDIARRPFFASVLARSILEGTEPQTEVDLINAWWKRAGHDATPETALQRQRALIAFAEKGARNLGKGIPVRDLDNPTIAQVPALQADHIIRDEGAGVSFAFAHDIFFEWSFFRLLIELGDDWTNALQNAGQAPLLGRVVGLMAQEALTQPGRWSAGYKALASKNLRRQWQREWLTAPPFTPAFVNAKAEFAELLRADGFALFEKVLVWFQAQHTIPSPYVLGTIKSPVDGIDNLAVADMLGWPSDFRAWGRLIDWVIEEADAIPVRLIPRILEIFDVWQNALSDIPNARSKTILQWVNGWLLRFEKRDLHDKTNGSEDKAWRFSRDDASRLGESLRMILLRSARSYPEYAKGLFKRVIADEDRRSAVCADLMAFAPIMAQVAPALLADLAEAQLIEELPEDELKRKEQERETHYKRLVELRAIPKDKRTEQQKRVLSSASMFFPIGNDRYDLDDIGIEAHNNFYYPTSALNEPFKSLFQHKPDIALRLVRNLANHATVGWRQIHAINRQQLGTPIPVSVAFPWGAQQFWGDWRIYSWGMGQLAPQPLECAFLALNYWVFKEIEGGRPASDVIKDIVEGNECYAVLGIALLLALETWATTETSLAVATCQRLWAHDFARFVQDPHKEIDLLGFGFLSQLTGEKAAAKEYLAQRKSRKRHILQLAMLFALNSNAALRDAFKAALARFPQDLPYELDEQKSSDEYTEHLRQEAERLAGLGDASNYKETPYDDKQVAIVYESPKPRTDDEKKRLDESTTSLRGFNVVGWAIKSLDANQITDGLTLEQAVAHAKSVDTATAFDKFEESASSPQFVVGSVAACVIRFGDPQSADIAWAWDVMARIEAMSEPPVLYGGSKIPWHVKTRLVIALFHDRRSATPRADSAERLMRSTRSTASAISRLPRSSRTGTSMSAGSRANWP
jgi:hypothetical protein